MAVAFLLLAVLVVQLTGPSGRSDDLLETGDLGGPGASSRLTIPTAYFTENVGQLGARDVLLYASLGGLQVGFGRGEVLIHQLPETLDSQGVLIRLQFRGGNLVAPEGQGELAHRSNFFIGNDPALWRTGVRNFAQVAYKGVYDGIDLVYRATESGLKYEFIVSPAADPTSIEVVYAGVEPPVISDGELVLTSGGGELRDTGLVGLEGERTLGCSFVPRSTFSIGFSCPGWDRRERLVIDPLIYSTFLGGGGIDLGNGVVVDGSGDVYVTGATWSVDFPSTIGSYDPTYATGYDVFVAKLTPDPSGPTPDPSDLVYSTFIGGCWEQYICDDYGQGIAVDGEGNAYVAGGTRGEFPISPGAYDDTFNGFDLDNSPGAGDAFVLKLNPSGSALLYSTYIGGVRGETAWSITVDAEGVTYVTGETRSYDFPTIPGAFDRSFGAGSCPDPYFEWRPCEDAFVLKLRPDPGGPTPDPADLLYSTFLGGGEADIGYALAYSAGFVHVGGGTRSTNYSTTPGAYDTTFNSGGCKPRVCDDAFVAKLVPDPNNPDPIPATPEDEGDLLYSSFLGGAGNERAYGIAIGTSNQAYLAGETASPNFPLTAGVHDASLGGSADAFVTRLQLDVTNTDPIPGTPEDEGDLVYSTYLGGSATEQARSIGVDSEGTAFVGGRTSSGDFVGFTYGPRGGLDVFVARLRPDPGGSTPDPYDLVSLAIVGGTGGDELRGLALDGARSVHITGFTVSPDYPTSPGPFDDTFNSVYDAIVTKLSLPAGSVSGIVWNDADRDGLPGPMENGIWGALVTLAEPNGNPLAITTTGYGGFYSFPDLAFASYRVLETNLYGWVSTTPDDVPVTLTYASPDAVVNFGDYSPEGREDPSYAVSLGIGGGGSLHVPLGLNIPLRFVITNSGNTPSQLRFLAFTAAIRDSLVVDFEDPPTATWQLFDHADVLLASGAAIGTLAQERHAGFDPTGTVLFRTSTWILPEVLFLEGGGRLDFCFPVVGVGVGQTDVELFPRSSEDNPDFSQGIPLAAVNDKRNLWQDNSTGLWYPAHNSYDPWDDDLHAGHSWLQFSWMRRPTDSAYAKGSYTVIVV